MSVQLVTADSPADRATIPLTLDVVAAVARLAILADRSSFGAACEAHGMDAADVYPLVHRASPEVERAVAALL